MNSILHNLDNFFKDKSENEKWMLIMMLTIVIGYISYTLFLPYAEAQYNASMKEKKRLRDSIIEHNQYIASITVNGNINFYVEKYDRDIARLNDNIVNVNKDINFITGKLDELSPLLFNKESWSTFLNSITAQAKKQNVKIDYINNEYIDSNGSFGHILEISVGCVGEYRNIAKFMNRLEKNILVTDIYQSIISLDENRTTTIADINISVWGINH
jgi:hypothetical protein